MDFTHRLAISYYKTIATINESHKIYLVQHQDTHKIYVKKILDVYNIDIYERLHNCPIIGTPRIIDYCEENKQLIIIEEYISGCSLKDKIQTSEILYNDILQYMLDLCNILEKLHSMNPAIIHRDIKPTNIIITSYNHAVLIDFNAAKQFSKMSEEDTILLGTQGYAAPEQYGFGSSSPQTDIYSLGIVLKEMSSALSSKTRIFEPIIEKCVKINQTERYANIHELKYSILSLVKPKLKHLMPNDLLKYVPPGYRTRTPWKMIISSDVYIFLFWLCLSLELKNKFGVALWIERIVYLAIMLSIIFCCFNYRDIHRIIPICKHKNRFIRYFGIVLLNVTVIFSLFIFLFIIETICLL